METREIRTESIILAGRLGIAIPDALPLLDDGPLVRDAGETVNRLLAMTAIVAVSHGFDRARAMAWVEKEGLGSALVREELDYLRLGRGNREAFRARVEGMWALAWSVGIVNHMDFSRTCDENFVTLLPDLKAGESCAKWRTVAQLRALDDLRAQCDLAYCLHWALRQSQLSRTVSPLRGKTIVVEERRRALDWLFDEAPWDEITLDT
jgi:hypothetical protein